MCKTLLFYPGFQTCRSPPVSFLGTLFRFIPSQVYSRNGRREAVCATFPTLRLMPERHVPGPIAGTILNPTVKRVDVGTPLCASFSQRSDTPDGHTPLRNIPNHRVYMGGTPFVYPIFLKLSYGRRSSSMRRSVTFLRRRRPLCATGLSHPRVSSFLSPGLRHIPPLSAG